MTFRFDDYVGPGSGAGAFTLMDVARILDQESRTVRRWIDGYLVRKGSQLLEVPAVLYRPQDADPLISFRELVELAFVREFRRAGVRLEVIRDASAILRDEWQTAYPLSRKKLKTEGRQMLLMHGTHFKSIVENQYVFDYVEELLLSIEVDEKGYAKRWHPIGELKEVVIDPLISQGTPVAGAHRIPTETLYFSYVAEKSFERIAEWYDVGIEAVRQAVTFESRWRRAKIPA